MRKSLIGIILLSIVIFGIALPIGFSAQSNTKVITYGETTYNNANYKSVVDDFFKQQAHVDVKSIDSKIITAGEVNKVASTITGKTYTSLKNCTNANKNRIHNTSKYYCRNKR